MRILIFLALCGALGGYLNKHPEADPGWKVAEAAKAASDKTASYRNGTNFSGKHPQQESTK